ncbi:hypothetical protein ACM55F_01205 [Flavobacterium sp. XS2P12]|uniref:hypothetical protein n=1 Tax=Flavobacterium melibiosi TaxID=3398734 RepID=UPI003A83B183
MESKFTGMTVNERLYVGGLMNDFDNCLKQKDVDGIKSILRKLELNEESIFDIIVSLGLDS